MTQGGRSWNRFSGGTSLNAISFHTFGDKASRNSTSTFRTQWFFCLYLKFSYNEHTVTCKSIARQWQHHAWLTITEQWFICVLTACACALTSRVAITWHIFFSVSRCRGVILKTVGGRKHLKVQGQKSPTEYEDESGACHRNLWSG
jgi:hypothetical protein